MKDRIKEIRKYYNFTQEQFAEKLGLSRDTIANIENDRIEIKEIVIKSICLTFNINEEWLRFGKDNMFIEKDESSIKDRLRELRINLGLSQEAFAKELGLTRNFISLVEHGNRLLSARSKRLLCIRFGINEEWLETGNGEMLIIKDAVNIKDRIKQIRKNCGLTQTEFGEKIGVKGNTITNYETGLRKPTDAIILFICRTYRISEHWLRTGIGSMFDYDNDDDIFYAEDNNTLGDFRASLINTICNLDNEKLSVLRDIVRDIKYN